MAPARGRHAAQIDGGQALRIGLLHHLEQIGGRRKIACRQRLGRLWAGSPAHPLVFEVLADTLSQRPIDDDAALPGADQRRAKCQHGRGEDQQHGDHGAERQLSQQLRTARAARPDMGQRRRRHDHAGCDAEDGEGAQRIADEHQPRRPFRMRGDQPKLQARYEPEVARPKEKAPEPSEQQDQQQGQRDQRIPPARQRAVQRAAAVPIGQEGCGHLANDQKRHHVRQHDGKCFRQPPVAQPQDRLDDRLVGRHLRGRHHASFTKAPRDLPEARDADRLGEDEQRRCDQGARMDRSIAQEGIPDLGVPVRVREQREHQQRPPADAHHDQRTPPHVPVLRIEPAPEPQQAHRRPAVEQVPVIRRAHAADDMPPAPGGASSAGATHFAPSGKPACLKVPGEAVTFRGAGSPTPSVA